MKSILLGLLLVSGLAQAQYTPYGVQIYQSDAAGAFLYGRMFTPPTPSNSYFLMYSGSTMQPALGAIGSGLSFDGTTLSAAGTAPSQSAQTRSLNTAYQISSSRAAFVHYSVQITVTASISGGQNGDVFLEIASDVNFTSNVQTLAVAGSGQTYTLAVAIQGIQPQTSELSGYVPLGYYTRLRTVQNTGTPSFLYRFGQEVLM